MKQDNKKTGAIGEKAAEEFLRKKGYQILERNFQTRFGEIDIICRKNNVVIFIEVKTKSGDAFGEPWEMVNRHKLQQVKNMGEVWNIKNNWQGLCRVDVVGVWLDGGEVDKIEHWEDVQIE